MKFLQIKNTGTPRILEMGVDFDYLSMNKIYLIDTDQIEFKPENQAKYPDLYQKALEIINQ